jgi:DNA-binding SARP family transcriptional activator
MVREAGSASVQSSTLLVRLLGEFDVRHGGSAMPLLESARAESLLAYLLLHRQAPQPRQRVAFLLWPDSSEAQARTNLRHVLHNLRRALPEPERYLDVTARTLRWRPDAPYRLDVAVFEEAMARADQEPACGVAGLREAVDAYTGDLLTGHDHDEWILEERDRLRRRYLDGLELLVARLQELGDLSGAVGYAERLLREDPLREETYRLLIRLHDARRDRARALRVYHECAAMLESELGVEPAVATREAYEALLPGVRDQEPSDRGRVGGTDFVGRFAERSRLTVAWRAAQNGPAGMVLLAGEPGVGKTRLAEEFRSWCGHRGAVTAVARAYPAEGALAYGPVVAWLRSEEFRPWVQRLDPAHLVELARLLPELRAGVPGLARPKQLPEIDQRQRLYDAVARTLLAPGKPVVLLADDVHWWDRESLQLLHYLLRMESETAALVVATARREDLDNAGPVSDLLTALLGGDRLTEIELERLDREETALLAERLTRTRLARSDADTLYAQTEGNPLFVVEAMRAGWQTGGDLLTPKVQAVVESRLAQLSGAARNLVDVAATIGREFTAEVLSLASQVDEDTVVRGLDELWRRRIIREHNAVAYDFSHDKIREVAYLALSPVRRRHLHGQVANALEKAYAGDLTAVSGQLARHYENAGALDQAVTWCARAADTAQQLHAHSEAARLLTRAVDLLRALPATPERSAKELELLTALPAPLLASEGYASPRVFEVQQQALALARSLGVDPAPPLLRSLAVAALARADFAAAREYGLALRARGEHDADDVLRVESEYVLGVTAFWAAELADARTHFERAVELYRDENRQQHLLRYGQDPKVVCLSRLAYTHWFLGHAAAAIRIRDEAIGFAEQIKHPYSHVTALFFAALLAVDMRDVPALRRCLDQAAAVLPEDAGVQSTAAIAALTAYREVLDGRPTDGITRIRAIRADPRTTQPVAPGLRAALVRILLAACEAAGDARTGLAAAEELLETADSRVWDPEAARLRATFRSALQRASG